MACIVLYGLVLVVLYKIYKIYKTHYTVELTLRIRSQKVCEWIRLVHMYVVPIRKASPWLCEGLLRETCRIIGARRENPFPTHLLHVVY